MHAAPAAPKLGVADGFDPKGKRIFEGACASCHSWTGQGSLNPWATLTGDAGGERPHRHQRRPGGDLRRQPAHRDVA